MDRLATGRRHQRAGSVTVTELITRQASPTPCTDSSPRLDDDITETIPVVVQAAHRRKPAKGVQLAKLASLGVAGAVLCGAVTISSVIAHHRRDNGHALRPSVQITGERALLPDELDQAQPQRPADTPAPSTPSAAENRPSPVTPVAASSPASPVPDTGTTASGGAVTAGPASDLELVREFYENLPESPVAAFDLLSPDVLGTNLSEFLSSWSTVVAVDTVGVVQRADGVLATVRMRLADGGHLRIEQLLTVAESPRRIVGVQLLSAQRT
ncbi:hypothetical protein [Actinophytocola sp.]|uniref:hypothetical protein n=1 Tax=Actinophytocola sp. TaxID=1872138 RepID=UPI00389AB899